MRELSLAALSALELTPPQLVSCAAEAGYSHVGLRLLPATPQDRRHDVIGDTPMVRGLQSLLANTGVRVLDVEIVRLKPETRADEFLPMLETGARLGARHVLVAANDPDLERFTARFAELCALAAPFGLSCQIEPMPWTELRTAAAALRAIEASGAANAGVLIDAIHWHRVDGTLAELAVLPPARLHYLQLCDAPVPRPRDMDEILDQARAQRRYPGEGGIDLAGLLRTLPAGLPLSLEIPRRDLAALPAHQRALDARKATLALLRRLGETV